MAAQIAGRRRNRDLRRTNASGVQGIHGKRPEIVLARLQRPGLIQQFGNIVHVWSTYESRHNADDATPFARGINSIQLLKDGDRYWIVNILWDSERPSNPIPAKYLP